MNETQYHLHVCDGVRNYWPVQKIKKNLFDCVILVKNINLINLGEESKKQGIISGLNKL